MNKKSENQNLTSKDKDGNILVNGEFKICNIPVNCSGSRCGEMCIINRIIRRLYKFKHEGMTDG